jgi:hypothetical protein
LSAFRISQPRRKVGYPHSLADWQRVVLRRLVEYRLGLFLNAGFQVIGR